MFPRGAVGRLRDCGLFDRVVCTDSHPQAALAAQEHAGFLEVLTLAEVLADAIRTNP